VSVEAPPLADIQLDLGLRVDRMRSFSYRSTARADHDGRYGFTVPYSTELREGVAAEGPYRIQTGLGEATLVHVSENAVMRGLEVSAGTPGER
jgi:hypothetical protein